MVHMNHDWSYEGFMRQLFDTEKLFEKPKPLKGVRVLEVCYVVLGPAACDYLAEFGAEVITFEGQRGEQMRFVTPFAYSWKNLSPGLEEQNHNKYWVGMHLGHPKAKSIFLNLVRKSDVVVDNLTPGRRKEWGLSYPELKEINPRIIQLHVSGYGSWGPWTGRASYDAVAQCMGALSPITGFEGRGPIKSGVWIADWITGLMCATAITAALNYREHLVQNSTFKTTSGTPGRIKWLCWAIGADNELIYRKYLGTGRGRLKELDVAVLPSVLASRVLLGSAFPAQELLI
jgi:CoA-transferase family III